MRAIPVAALLSVLVVVHGAAVQPSTVIRNVTVIDPASGASRLGNIVMTGDRITGVSTAVPAGAQVIDGTGKFAIPGLWDMHVHLVTRPEPNLAEEMILPALLAHGIVGARDMGGPLDRVMDLRRKVASGAIIGPRILTPGPFIDGPGDASPLFRRPANAAAVTATVQELQAGGVDFVKAQSGLTPALHAALVKSAKSMGLAVAGHIPVEMDPDAVFGSGQRSVEHISPALVGDGLLLLACSSRANELMTELRAIEASRGKADAAELGRRETALRTRAVETYDPARARAIGASLKGRDVWIVPTLVWSSSLRPTAATEDGRGLPMDLVPKALRTRWTDRRKAYIAQAGEAGLAAAARLAETSARAVRDLNAGGARILAGTDAFDAFVLPGHSLHQELQLLVRGGLRPAEALRTATFEAAAYRGSLATEGTIAAGKRADLVLLDDNPLTDISNTTRIHLVIAGGTLHDRAALDRIREAVKAFADR